LSETEIDEIFFLSIFLGVQANFEKKKGEEQQQTKRERL